jgi:membrane associated rhomboid family serine protease/tetratricopeptide (TPR) repeat protein
MKEVRDAAARFVRAYPVTSLIVVVAIGLHVALWVARATQPGGLGAAYRALGAVRQMEDASQPELSGPFDLWRGEWWRIPLSALHHADPLHLAFNCLAFAYLGRLLEPQLRRGTYLALVLVALLLPMLPRLFAQSLWGGRLFAFDTVGLSGAVYVLLGVLLVLRDKDPRPDPKQDSHQDSPHPGRLPAWVVAAGIFWLLGCLLFEVLGWLRLDNLAHVTGLVYGWLAGHAITDTSRFRWVRAAFVTASLLVIPLATFLVIHPDWNGRWHWWLAQNAADPAARQRHFKDAVDRNPGLAWPWYHLAAAARDRGDLQEAWQLILKGLEHNRSFDEGRKLAGDIWQRFATTDERRQALERLAAAFPGEEEVWRDRLIPLRQLAGHYLTAGDYPSAWRAAIRDLSIATPSSRPDQRAPAKESERLARSIWGGLATRSQRRAALEALADVFGPERRRWQKRLVPRADLIAHYRDIGELLWAWQAVLEELAEQPDSAKALAQAEAIYAELPTELRRHRARRLVEKFFGPGPAARQWQFRLGVLPPEVLRAYRPDQRIDLPPDFPGTAPLDASGHPIPHGTTAPPVDPQAPDSARHGGLL